MVRTLSCLLGVLLFVGDAFGWSNKEHIQLTRIAAQQLIIDPDTPAAMKEWLKKVIAGGPQNLEEEKEYLLHKRIGIAPRGVDGLPFWAVMPDMMGMIDREKPLEKFGVAEQKLHYIDVELFMPDAAAQKYAPDLSHKPALKDFPRDISDERYKRAGMLPFAVEHAYGELVRCLRTNRLDDQDGKFPRDDHATKWAGYLAHYLQDNTQPHHASEDYQSRSYFPLIKDPRKTPNAHGDVEYRLVDDEHNDYADLREEFASLFVEAMQDVEDPSKSPDLWTSTLQISLFSYDALPLIGKAAVAAYPNASDNGPGKFNADAFFHFKGDCMGKQMTVLEMKARQQALAVKRTQTVLLRAWNEAHK
ncbi:MAG TPA: hypothetical protein VGP99_13690 [Tepidisphaeraceae bacterium]|jgi:hypothetical protein|nr:hypothetical protein [Tepidisphaeraceae bacterium]